ncbi:alkylhydroperoxidase AhpD family core domain-containing protein [Chryseolinea serpens]|uniref:Alkylhydroperoxidase AhpD family core domain-containing protein n=1 Tax=Chryseolinea serpens TaxID=947013 RepID=A0A1M5KQU5_9BACT|nr:carboxymuconolactone decarboxylase family protein [Chryseolinea serpens]SHG55086.1 alkylhydroperoxidase AhpD family core domain-containing protein [Chryseolinea serpens]
MEPRKKFQDVDPDALKAMLALEKYLSTTQLSVRHKDLIKIRTSQLNGCSYCIDKHTEEARANGETERRLYNITSWNETPFFTEDEQAILALTEQVTFITNRVSDEVYNRAVKLLGEKYVTQAMMAIVTMNAWNRIGVTTNLWPS